MPLMGRLAGYWVRLEKLGPRRLFVALFVIAVVVRMGLSLSLRSYLDFERYEMEHVALSYAHHGTLADPYGIPTGPTAHEPPVYPILMGLVFRYFGEHRAGELVKELLGISFAAAQYGLLPLAGAALGVGWRAGLAAGLVGALLPMKYSTEVAGDWEATAAALVLLLACWAAAVTWRRGAFSIGRGAAEGLLWGLALLISSALLPVFFGLLLLALIANRTASWRYVAAGAATAALCLAPWAWRNQRQLGAPIFTRSNGGLELHLSNNDLAGPLEPVNYQRGLYFLFHPSQNRAEAGLVRSRGEAAYNLDRLRQALLWMRAHPTRFLELTELRFWYTWFPATAAIRRDALLWVLTLGWAGGLFFLWRVDRMGALLMTAIPAFYTPLFYLIHVNVRHRYPVDWVLLLGAAYFTVRMLEQRTRAAPKELSEVSSHA